MSIAFDAASTTNTGSATSLTYAYTCTGANGILFVGVAVTANSVTGATYNGVAMTLVDNRSLSGDAAGFTNILLFVLVGPATGSNNVVISASGSITFNSRAVSYTGVKQTTLDAHATAGPTSGITSLTATVTSVASGCWVVAYFRDDQASLIAGTGTMMRGSASQIAFGDSNAALIAGSNSLQATWTGSGNAAACIASIAPVANPNQMFAVF